MRRSFLSAVLQDLKLLWTSRSAAVTRHPTSEPVMPEAGFGAGDEYRLWDLA